MSKFIKVKLSENREKYINSDKITEIRNSEYGSYISMGETGYYVLEKTEEILKMIDYDISGECVACGEYSDYHCDKFCTIIRHTVKDLKEYYADAIPVEFIRSQMEIYQKEKMEHLDNNNHRLAISSADKHIALTKLIADWTAWVEKEEHKDDTD